MARLNAEIQRKMVLWTLLLVIGLGALNFLIMVRPPSATQTIAASQGPSLSARRPAAAQQAEGGVKAGELVAEDPTLNLAVDFEMPCPAGQPTTVADEVRQVRLAGKYCLAGAEAPQASTIRNETNGFIATVFYPRGDRFTTDYISLEKGANKVSVTHLFANQRTETYEVMIDREPARAK